METVLLSAITVAIAEIGDKTQFLAILLAARFRKPMPIIAGIFCATLANHLVAALIGVSLGDFLSGPALRWVLGISFLAMAAWTLVPDKADGLPSVRDHWGVFGATIVAFFLVEIGDKTQIATMALAARFHSIGLVAIGTTTGLLAADVPAVFLGEYAAEKLPLRLMRFAAALIFAAFGVLTLLNVGGLF
jgi:putative Ca2+/H+ antiporter (TMEM165/GDT1 family)